MQKKSFTSPIRQTHFIGVLVPENLIVPLEACRAWMRARFGCKSGQGTPLHITLVPPFCLDEKFSERTLFEALAEAASAWNTKSKTLCCAVNGFGAFSSRTIFAHVEPSSEWTALRTLVYDSPSNKMPGNGKARYANFCTAYHRRKPRHTVRRDRRCAFVFRFARSARKFRRTIDNALCHERRNMDGTRNV